MILFELDHFGSIIAVATATLKLPNRRRIVFSDGRMAASVQLSAVEIEPCSATNLRRVATASAIRVSAMSGIGTASPSNTPGGFALWELRSTNLASHVGDTAGYGELMSAASGSSGIAPALRVLSWDFEESPPFDDIEQFVNELLQGGAKEIRLAEADTGSDDFGLVISDRSLTESQLAEAWQQYLDSFAPP